MLVDFPKIKLVFNSREFFVTYYLLSFFFIIFYTLNAFIYTKGGVYFLLKNDVDFKKVVSYLKKSGPLRFSLFTDLVCVDYLDRAYRFELVYNLLSVFLNFRIFLKLNIFYNRLLPYGQGIASLEELFSSAGWLEREVWDMFGIFFFYHKDLRRILTDYGFMGFPLRKDFPLMGFKESRYDDFVHRVVTESIKTVQVYRLYGFDSSW